MGIALLYAKGNTQSWIFILQRLDPLLAIDCRVIFVSFILIQINAYALCFNNPKTRITNIHFQGNSDVWMQRDMGIKDMSVFSRLKREECKRTKHDSAFSEWKNLLKEATATTASAVNKWIPSIRVSKIDQWKSASRVLIGPSDWENYLLRKEGIERYRNRNLPLTCSCPGLYELGVASTRINSGRDVRKLDQNGIIVVYLGQADNIRARLQDYGRGGSHLDRGKSTNNPNGDINFVYQRGPGLFKEIFSKGFPIVFRWASLENKKAAEKTETQLLRVFDYAWNTGGNGARRPNDILLKLDKINSSPGPFLNVSRKLQQWLLVLEQPFLGKKSGIRIKSVSPIKSDASNDRSNADSRPRIFKFGRTQPRLVFDKCVMNEEDAVICGVSLGDGSACRVKPVRGRKRCEDHKGKRIIGCVQELVKEDKSVVCGVNLEDGSCCIEVPVQGRKRCELHKGMKKISTLNSVPDIGSAVSQSSISDKKSHSKEHSSICGVFLSDASVCNIRPIDGRKRCALHKGMKISTSKNVHEKGSTVSNLDNIPDRKSESEENCTITCGVLLRDGSVCDVKPIEGRKRCGEHRGQRVNGSICKSQIEETCGVGLGDGSVCKENPVKGRKRCEMHKGRRIK